MRDFFDLQNVVLVGSETLRQAVRSVVACEFCHTGAARVPFDRMLERATGRSSARARYVLVECVAECPSCRRELAVTTLVEVTEERSSLFKFNTGVNFWSSDLLR